MVDGAELGIDFSAHPNPLHRSVPATYTPMKDSSLIPSLLLRECDHCAEDGLNYAVRFPHRCSCDTFAFFIVSEAYSLFHAVLKVSVVNVQFVFLSTRRPFWFYDVLKADIYRVLQPHNGKTFQVDLQRQGAFRVVIYANVY